MNKAAKVTCEVYKAISPQAQAALEAMRLDLVQTHARRAVVLRERAPLAFLPPTTRLEEDPVEVLEFYLPRAHAHAAVLALARELRLFGGGRGAIFAEEVELLDPAGFAVCAADFAAAGREHAGERLSPLVLVNCVVQRGHGNDIARCALEIGSNVPSVNYGIGTGVRDRLGLLRIAIPAEKEIVTLLVEPDEEEAALEALIAAGRLDQPGRGFVGACPVAFGVANPKSFRGRQRHGATMDQVITAIDELASGTEWRRRAGTADLVPHRRRHWLKDRLNVTLNCNEGSSDRLLAIAMAGGAGGATISKAKFLSPGGRALKASPARELIDFGLAPEKLDALLRALRDGGAFSDEAACIVETKPLPLAFTYTGG